MRLFGILAIFILSIAAIVEGAVLVRLSSRLDSLSEKLESAPSTTLTSSRVNPLTAPGVSPGRGAEANRPTLPRLVPAPSSDDGASAPATAVLRQALETPEGRGHLKAAMEVLHEQDRQERLVRNADEEVADEQRYRERLARLAALNPDEQNRVGLLYTNLQSGRRRVIEEMRAGVKNAEQADDEIDNLEDETQRQVRALLGDERMRKFREASRAERQRERGRRDGGGGGNAPAANAAPLPGAPAPPAAP